MTSRQYLLVQQGRTLVEPIAEQVWLLTTGIRHATVRVLLFHDDRCQYRRRHALTPDRDAKDVVSHGLIGCQPSFKSVILIA